jgi:hypothetical protein
MRLLGLSLLFAGWLLVLAALVLLKTIVPLAAFVIASLAVEVLGLGFLARTYIVPRGERE